MNVLITGGSGSFGRAFTRKLIDLGAERIVIFSRDEVKQAEMRQEFPQKCMRFFIGDVRDRDRLTRAFHGIETVIHAAALKRIEVGRYNPMEMVKTNVMGAMNVIEAAQDAKVHRVIALSTDKAYQPVSAYGQSKALMESMFLAANDTVGKAGPFFSVTRYGNVAGSRGSVIPVWREILKSSDAVPVTDPEATRFFMTIDQAVDLVLKTMGIMPKDVVIPDLPAFRLADLAEAMGAKMDVRGLPAYEKLHEGMADGNTSDVARRMTVDELRQALIHV